MCQLPKCRCSYFKRWRIIRRRFIPVRWNIKVILEQRWNINVTTSNTLKEQTMMTVLKFSDPNTHGHR